MPEIWYSGEKFANELNRSKHTAIDQKTWYAYISRLKLLDLKNKYV